MSNQVSAKNIIVAIDAKRVIFLPDGHEINADAFRQLHLPLVLRNPRKDMVPRELPTRSEVGIFYPNIFVVRRARVRHQSVLCEDGSPLFDTALQYLPLIFDEGLQSNA